MKNKVIDNAFWLIACRVIKALIGAVVSILTARMLGPGNFGLISYASSITAFFAPIALLGFNSILVQELVQNPESEGELSGTAIFFSLISSVICVGLTALTAYILTPDETETVTVCALFSISLIFQATELIQYSFQAEYKSKYVAFAGLFAYVLVSAYKICLLALHVRIYWFALSNALDYLLISAILMLQHRRKRVSRPMKIRWETFRRLFAGGKYYIISSLMIVVFAQTDKVMIKNMLGNDQTGFYSAAVSCAGVTVFLFSAIIEAMRPHILEGRRESMAVFEERLKALYSVLIYAALLCSIVFSLGAPLITLLFGEAYSASVKALRVVIWYTVLSCIGGAKDIWILSEHREHYLPWLNTFGAVLNIGLNLLLIPRMGIVGAAAATLITQTFSNIILCVIIKELRHNMCLLLKASSPQSILGLLRRGVHSIRGR